MDVFKLNKQLTEKVLLVIFTFFAFAYTATLQCRPYFGSYVIKAIPIISLAVFSLIAIPKPKGIFVFNALLFSALGDILLAFEGNNYFIYGLGAFGLAHIMYINAFLSNGLVWKKRSYFLLFFIAYGLTIEFILFPNLGKMLIYATIYLILLMSLGISSVLSRDRDYLVISGAVLFIISDSIIAFNTFYIHVPYSSLWIMATYYPAQLLITMGSKRANILYRI